jgi:hypothetical protein
MENVMMKMSGLILLSCLMSTAANCAETLADSQKKQIVLVETESFDTVMDMTLRVGGFIATVVGTGLFIGTSPLTGIMTAFRPHKSIQQSLAYLVMRPVRYTFIRPVSSQPYDIRPSREQ